MSATKSPGQDVNAPGRETRETADRSSRLSDRPSPSAPEFWRSPLRGPWLTSFLGTLLIPAVAVMLLTGFISHWAYYPEGTVDGRDLPVLFHIPASWPTWSYAVNQGTHVTLGLMTLPFVLAKLWSVMPKLFQRPVVSSFANALERISLLALVASVLVEFATGILDVDNSFGGPLDFNTVHYYGAWVFGTLFVLHACVSSRPSSRLPHPRALKPLLEGLPQTAAEPPVAGVLPPQTQRPPRSAAAGCWRWWVGRR